MSAFFNSPDGKSPQGVFLLDPSTGQPTTVSGGGGGGGGGGSVTSAGNNGTNAQAVQGINNGVPVRTMEAGVVFINSTGNNVNIAGLGNASYGQLAAGASFQGTWDDVFSQPAAQILGGANQPLKYTIEQAIDSAGTKIISSVVFTRPAGQELCENVQLNGNYVRVTVKNVGYATTTDFTLNTTLGDLPPLPQSLDNNGNLKVVANSTSNFTRKFRDAMEVWPNANWTNYSKASGDLIQIEGNALGASYLTLSLDPLSAGTETYVESDAIYSMPLEVAVGLHRSNLRYGQELSFSIIDTNEDGVLPAAPAEIQISSIQQATTTLTVTCATAHGLRVGQRIGIYGVNNDSRLNYAALVVASVPSSVQFTVTAGPQGTLPSLTVGPFSPAAAFVYHRDSLSFAENGTAMIYEKVGNLFGAFYAKCEGGDTVPLAGTLNGDHSIATGSSATAYPITSSTAQYIGRPNTMQILSLAADRVYWSDEAVDAVGSQSVFRAGSKQVVPDPDKYYKLRFKVTNRKGFTVPVAKIVSAAKTGTTTATVITNVPHGLTTGDYITTCGVRDQTNFANITTGTVVASVVNSTTFTVVWGSAVTATSYGGVVFRVQGQSASQGFSSQVVQSASITSGILTLIGNTTWTGASIGDLVNVHGVRADLTGADIGVDGIYRVRDIVTTSLILEPVGGTSIPGTLGSVNCGGTFIQRTDFRISFIRLFDYERLRVEMQNRPAGDLTSSQNVVVSAFTPSINIQGAQANQSTTVPQPLLVSGLASSSNPGTGTTGRQQQLLSTLIGALVSKPYSIPEADWRYTGTLTTNVAVAVRAAGAAGIKNYVTGLQVQNTNATATTFLLQDGGTTIFQVSLPASMTTPISFTFNTPLGGTAATAMNANCGTTGANVITNVQGYFAP